jgi:hypothetical protein
MTTKTKLLRVAVAAGLAVSAAVAFGLSTAGAQSVPLGGNNGSQTGAPANPPANPPGTPPQSPVEPPVNNGGAGGAGTGPSLLPTAGTGTASDSMLPAELALMAALGTTLATTGLAVRRNRR